MSIVRCNHCNKNIDTDFDAEHFVPDTEHCLIQVEAAAPDLLEALMISYNSFGGGALVTFQEHQILQINNAIKKATS